MAISKAAVGQLLSSIYADCHDPRLIDPDPLSVVREYSNREDREIAALFCACLALGRAGSIVVACRSALGPFGPFLRRTVSRVGDDGTLRLLSGFRYRFFGARDAAALLRASVYLSEEFGSLEDAFLSASSSAPYPAGDASSLLLARCDAFVDAVRSRAFCLGGLPGNLLPAPKNGSACKRLFLFLRWMVRMDAVDPGGWNRVSTSELVLPLDVHLHRISRALGLTERSAPDLKTALEVTRALRAFDPVDPVRFDFSLARLGIRSDYSLKSFIQA